MVTEARTEQLWETLGLPDELRDARVQRSIRPTAAAPTLPLGTASAAVPAGGSEGDGDLVVLDTLGEGGMGVVFRAHQRSLGREVALKRLKPGASPVAADRLLAEARVTGALEHPNIVPVHALRVDDDGRPTLVMKRVEGVEWRELIARPDHPAWEGRTGDQLRFHVETLIQVCYAMELAHSRGVVHRDLKPANVMIGDFGEVYVLDWGIAVRAGESEGGGLAGTPAYMAPEMLLQDTITPRTDVYLLGAVLYEIMTGTVLHQGDSLVAVVESILEKAPPGFDSSVPDELAGICRRATHRDPDRRYGSVRELREALAAFLTHRSSVELTRESLARMHRLSELAGSDADQAELRRAFTECRFGLQQALRIWPENPRAREALDEVLRRMIDVELGRESADAAAALLEELEAPDAERAAALSALRERQERESERVQELERMAEDRDLGAQHRLRTLALLIFGGVIVLTAALGYLLRMEFTYPWWLGQQTAIIVIGAVIAGVGLRGRKHNVVSRQLFYCFSVGVIAGWLFTATGYLLDVPIVTTMLLVTLMLVPASVIVGLTLDRGVHVLAGFLLAGVIVALLWPRHRFEALMVGQIGGVVGLAVFWQLSKRARRRA